MGEGTGEERTLQPRPRTGAFADFGKVQEKLLLFKGSGPRASRPFRNCGPATPLNQPRTSGPPSSSELSFPFAIRVPIRNGCANAQTNRTESRAASSGSKSGVRSAHFQGLRVTATMPETRRFPVPTSRDSSPPCQPP